MVCTFHSFYSDNRGINIARGRSTICTRASFLKQPFSKATALLIFIEPKMSFVMIYKINFNVVLERCLHNELSLSQCKYDAAALNCLGLIFNETYFYVKGHSLCCRFVRYFKNRYNRWLLKV